MFEIMLATSGKAEAEAKATPTRTTAKRVARRDIIEEERVDAI